jgi:hypothetical protein
LAKAVNTALAQCVENEMTAIRTATLSQPLFERRNVRRNLRPDPQLIFAAALFLAVAIVALAIVVLAAPHLAEIGSLYSTIT